MGSSSNPSTFTTNLPERDRSCRVLAHHIFRNPGAFLEAAAGRELTAEAFVTPPGDDLRSREEIARYGDGVRERLSRWWGALSGPSCQAPVRTYYGRQPLHDLLERTARHSGQHAGNSWGCWR